ncbi:hypothetical protein [Candidatus Uabimicrobium sp. HlEnr_7]|uniref:hypothetical protein n=1 Tax=Candidatus Uabimicrobium helgolandensis TaxID=3095367 RepID=UPI0035584E39
MCEQKYIREKLQALIADGVKQQHIADKIGLHQANLSRFISGRQEMSEENVKNLYEKEIINKPNQYELKGIKNLPIEIWHGEVKKIKDVAHEKGYSAATIRKWCKEGKLNYVRPGRGYLVAIDEKYNDVVMSEKAAMRNKIEELEQRNAQLEEQVAKAQLNFSFDANNQVAEVKEENISLSDELRINKFKLKYEVENLQKENKQLKDALEQYQNTITRLTSQNEKKSILHIPIREKITSNSHMLCGCS